MRKSLIFLNIAIIVSMCSSAWSIGEGLGPMAPAMNMPGQPGSTDSSRSNQLEYRQRDGQDPKVQAAVEDIKSKLSNVLKLVNEANAPSATEMGDIEKTIKANLSYASRMSSTEKAYYHTLAAWYNYFNNQLKKARASAMAAFQADKNEINARITLIAMSIANDDTRSLKSAATMIKPKNAEGGTFNDPTQMQMPQSQLGTTLDFNADSIIPDMLGAKLAIGTAKCINGTVLNSAGKNTYIVIWNLASVGEAAASTNQTNSAPGMTGMPGMGGMGGYSSGQQVAPMQAFANVFQQHFASANVAFLGINTDAVEDGAKVMGVLAKNAWPWAQAMANDSENTGLALFTKAKLASPMLVATSPDGTVVYAGSPGGVLPRILAAKVASGAMGNIASAASQYAKKKPADAAEKALAEANIPDTKLESSDTATTSTDSNTAAADATVQNQTSTATTEAAATDEPQVKAHKTEEETFNPQASQLYEQARAQMKTAKFTGYRNVVEMCRTVIREYPETTEAEKCRQLLREIPAARRQQFRVTNEEMGQ